MEKTFFRYHHKDGRQFKKYYGSRDLFLLVDGIEFLIGTVYNQDSWGFQTILRYHKVGGNETESILVYAL